jgi:hypothetical protein
MSSIEQHQLLDLSEADLHFCSSHGPSCGGWWPDQALDQVKTRGVSDDACFPYATAGVPNPTCKACADRDKRAVKITSHGSIANVVDRKNYLTNTGPCSAVLHVFNDFFSYHNGVYHHVSGADVGLHCVEVIGYSEAEHCWICKNSWGGATVGSSRSRMAKPASTPNSRSGLRKASCFPSHRSGTAGKTSAAS